MIYPLFPQIHQKYKFMEGSLASRRRKLKSQVGQLDIKIINHSQLLLNVFQVPDIKSSLAMITKLREKKEVCS